MAQAETDVARLNEAVREESLQVQAAADEVRKVIVGQRALVDRMMVALLCRGHLLVEGVPGLAKTLAVKTMGQVLDQHFARIQFTPDLLPADLVGTMIYQQKTGEFVARKGPVFTNLLLADEINRAPAKVQSALLEAMQERQVTLGDTSHPLPDPFLVFATQNPIEQEGTYPLPEAQVDRFLLKVKVDYPSKEEERQILDRMVSGEAPAVARVLGADATRRLARRVREVYMDDRLRDYMVALVQATRRPREVGLVDLVPLIAYGASPRATLAFSEAARAVAFLRGRGYVVPEDVKEIAKDVLRHRVLLTYEAEAENVTSDIVVERVLERVEVPKPPSMLDRETFQKIRRIQIRTRVILESGIGGAYHAVFKGRGMEFAEVREYQPGDEVRTIDWNVTARMGAPYVKKFVEERDLTLLLVVDLSGSQSFGSRFLLKRDYAAELAAVLAFSAVQNRDRVGAVLFTDRIEGWVPPGHGREHALRIVRDLLALQPRGKGTDLAGALRFAQRVMKRRGIVAVLSDFQAQGYERALGVLRRRHDVIALQLVDPHEGAFPNAGLVALVDPETGERFVVDASRPEVRRRLSASAAGPAAQVFRKARVDALTLSTAASYEQPLRAFFKAREEAGPVSALLALLLATVPAATASASKSEVTIGEVFTLEVKVEGPGGTTFGFPGEIAEEAYELRSQPAEPNADPNVRRYAAAVFALGEVEIAPVAVPYRRPDGQTGEVRTEPLKVKVASLLPKDPQEQKLADIRDPLGLGVGLAFWLALAALLGLGALIMAWFLWRRFRKPAVAAPVPTPDAEARQALAALSRSDLRAFYIQLTEIAKRYLERRLNAPVLEMTSAETAAFLRDHPATGSLAATVRDLTTAADAVKFARGQALDAEAERHLGAVTHLIDALEDKLRPAAHAGEAAA